MLRDRRGRAGARGDGDGGLSGRSHGTAAPLTWRTFAGVGEIAADVWRGMLPDDPESWDFYRLAEQVPPPGFKLGAIAVYDGDAPVAVAPLFRIDYRIDTPFQGMARRIGDWLYARVPRLVSFPVIGIGSPMSDALALGFAPGLSTAAREAAFECMLTGLRAEARAQRSALIAIKSIGSEVEALAGPLARHGFNRVTTVPVAVIDLDHNGFEDYLAALPKKDRSYLRRKIKSAEGLRIEVRSTLEGLEEEVAALFQCTLAESKVDYGEFEQVHPDYFGTLSRGLANAPEEARPVIMLFWLGETLIGFEMSLAGRRRVLTKHIGMRYPQARDHNLYFVSGLKLIEETFARGRVELELGATTYRTKLLFGARLERRWLCFRFRGGLANWMLRPLAPLFDFERNDAEIGQLKSERPGALFRDGA